MKKVVILANTLYSFGGGERWILEAAVRLKNRFEILIINPISQVDERRVTMNFIKEKYNLSGVKIIELKCTGKRTKIPGISPFITMTPTQESKELLESIIKGSDVVYSITSNPGLLPLLIKIAKKHQKRIILGLHNPELLKFTDKSDSFKVRAFARVYNEIQKKFMEYIGDIHVQTESQLDTLRKLGFKGNIFYIPHYLYTKPKMSESQKKNEQFIALFIGSRLAIKQKGLDLLEKIVETTMKRNTNIKFHIIGSGKEGQHIVESLSKKYPRNVKWYGFVTEKQLNEEYKNASIFIMPSRYETPGLTLFEAQSYGLPAIAFKVPGPTDIMKKDFQGKLITSFNTNEFAAEIVSFYMYKKIHNIQYRTLRLRIHNEIKRLYTENLFVRRFVKMINGT